MLSRAITGLLPVKTGGTHSIFSKKIGKTVLFHPFFRKIHIFRLTGKTGVFPEQGSWSINLLFAEILTHMQIDFQGNSKLHN